MRYIAPDDTGLGFATGEDVELKWAIYEDSSRKVEYRMREDDVITFIVRRGSSPRSEVLIWAESEPGSNVVRIQGEDTAWIRPGQYTAVAMMRIPSRGIDGVMIFPAIGEGAEGVFPSGNCLIAAGEAPVENEICPMGKLDSSGASDIALR